MTENLEKIIGQFDPISLEEINSIKDSVKLLTRHDVKYPFPDDKIPSLLSRLSKDYRILEINGKRIFRYENLYFDTPSSTFYTRHHNGKLNRHKLRFRRYADSDSYYLEIKFKSNKGKTFKERFEADSFSYELTDFQKKQADQIIQNKCGVDISSLKPSLWTLFSRITLANVYLKERLTIDFDIKYRSIEGLERTLDGMAVSELKKESLYARSPFALAAKNEMIAPRPFSKYCTGMMCLNDTLKRNRFKKRIVLLQKLCGGKLKCFSRT